MSHKLNTSYLFYFIFHILYLLSFPPYSPHLTKLFTYKPIDNGNNNMNEQYNCRIRARLTLTLISLSAVQRNKNTHFKLKTKLIKNYQNRLNFFIHKNKSCHMTRAFSAIRRGISDKFMMTRRNPTSFKLTLQYG